MKLYNYMQIIYIRLEHLIYNRAKKKKNSQETTPQKCKYERTINVIP